VFEEGRETPDHFALIEIFGDAAESFEIDPSFGGARCPEADADFIEREFALEGEEDFPFEIG
jgi:hypothetical protein